MNNGEPLAPLLTIEGLSVSYDGVPILAGLSLSVFPGQINALVGPEGAGKTTVLRAVSGLVRPEVGGIWFAGEAIAGLPVWEIVRRGIVYVPEGLNVFPRMSVLENLEIGAYLNRRLVAERLEEVYAIFPELKERRNALAGVLSGGQQRMVILGRGLMAGAKLLLLDDPFLELSPKLEKRFCETFQSLIQKGITLLVASQNVHRILQVADAAYLMEGGRITLSGPGPEILQDEHLREVLYEPTL